MKKLLSIFLITITTANHAMELIPSTPNPTAKELAQAHEKMFNGLAAFDPQTFKEGYDIHRRADQNTKYSKDDLTYHRHSDSWWQAFNAEKIIIPTIIHKKRMIDTGEFNATSYKTMQDFKISVGIGLTFFGAWYMHSLKNLIFCAQQDDSSWINSISPAIGLVALYYGGKLIRTSQYNIQNANAILRTRKKALVEIANYIAPQPPQA